MDKSEIFFEMQLPYDKLCSHLISKYGGAESDYGRKTTHTHDGLYCHHIDEDKGSNLGNAYQASTQPAEWQKKDRLVYCNILEHLILHIKIAVLRQKTLKKPSQVDLFISSSYGLLLICKEINDMYINAGTSVKWRQRCYEEVKTNYRDYIEILKSLLYYVFECYEGKKDELPFLRAGSVIHFSNYDCEITKVSRTFDKISLKMPSGEEETFNANIASLDFTFIDYLRFDTYKLACGFKTFYETIFNDIQNCDVLGTVEQYSKALSVDFHGNGFPQYFLIKLSNDFGSDNADEYISKALPMFCDEHVNIENKTPIFWSGNRIPHEATDCFFIVRIKTMFNIKKGQTPFVRYREDDLLRRNHSLIISENHNYINSGFEILATSDIQDEKTGKKYAKYVNLAGNLVDATVNLSLGSYDLELFKKKYNIRYFEILDGCYFK